MSDSSPDDGARRREFDVLIIGAGHAGAQVATALSGAFAGSIGLVTEEAGEPYEKPPLTKGFLTGDVTDAELLIRPAGFWEESGITLVLSTRVVEVNADAHTVVTSDGDSIHYGQLVWAAGADPVRIDLPGMKLPGVHELRTHADTVRFRGAISADTEVAVIGGGYIGLEAASACRKLGARVTVVESRERLLARVTGADVASHLLEKHTANGVHVELGATVTGLGESDGRVGCVELADGRRIDADVVLVSVGVRPNIDVLTAAGAKSGNGVEVDLRCRTSLSDIYAAGDCTSFPVEGGSRLRLESLQNAVEQGDVVAKSILGETVEFAVTPYFWSNQYDVKIKTIGLFAEHDDSVVRPGADSDSFSVVYLREGTVCAVDTVNSMRDYVDARKVIGSRVDVNVVRNPAVRLRDSLDTVPSGEGAS